MAESMPRQEPDLPPESPIDAGSRALSEALRSSFAILWFLMVLLVLLFVASGVFTVREEDRAIILRFGKPVGEGQAALLGPGLHWSYPRPIDERVKVSIIGVQQARSTIGWYAVTPAQELAHTEPMAGKSLNPAVDGYVITADNNIIHARATLNYHINDPIRFVFEFQNASNAVQNALDNALVYGAAHFTVEDIWSRNPLGFREAVTKRLNEIVHDQDLGIVVESCEIQRIPPRQLKEDFAKVTTAELGRSTALNGARSYEVQKLSEASSDATSITNRAFSDASALVREASGLAAQFLDQLPSYRQNPNLYTWRLVETLGRVFTNAQEKMFITESPDGKSKELRLMLNPEPEKKKE
jgi:modulator of FtsH protease HflK